MIFNIDPVKKDIGASCSAKGEGTRSLVRNSGLRSCTLTTFTSNTSERLFEISDGGIKVNKSGTYMINASVYIENVSLRGVYIKRGEAEIASSVMSAASWNSGSSGVTPIVIDLTAGDIIYLNARNFDSDKDGTVYRENSGTYLNLVLLDYEPV